MGCCNVRCGLIAGAVFGALVAILGGILIPVGDMMIKGTVEKEAVIEPGTTAHENWVSTGSAVYRQFWFFDVKNPKAVVNSGAQPLVAEKGPYTYRTRYLPKDEITFYSNMTVSFVLPMGAIFERSMSVGPEEDSVTTLNLGLAGAYAAIVPQYHPALELLMFIHGGHLFQQRTVKELLWGYNDTMLKREIALFESYNTTVDGPYSVYSGKDDISKVGIIDSWKGASNLPFWNDTYCDMINGTDASSFPPFVDKKKPIYFFSSDICRSVSASYQFSYDLKGIEVYRYSLLPSTLASPVDNPDNHCYCKNFNTTKGCTLAGVLDLSSCQDGKPIFMSLPHFLHGSRSLREDILGLNPNPDQHKTYLDIEPNTGFTLNFAKRIQVNMMYGPSKHITVLKKVKDYTIFPLLWMNETATLDDKTANMFKEELVSRIQMLEITQKVLMGVGAGIFLLCLISYCVVRQNHNGEKTP